MDKNRKKQRKFSRIGMVRQIKGLLTYRILGEDTYFNPKTSKKYEKYKSGILYQYTPQTKYKDE